MHSLFVSSYRAASIPSTRMPLTGGNHSSLCDSAVSAPRHLPLNRARSFRIHQLGPERRVDLPLPRRLISQRALSRTAALSSIHSTHAASIFLRRLSQRALSRLAARFPNRTSSACAASIFSDTTCQRKSLAMWIPRESYGLRLRGLCRSTVHVRFALALNAASIFFFSTSISHLVCAVSYASVPHLVRAVSDPASIFFSTTGRSG